MTDSPFNNDTQKSLNMVSLTIDEQKVQVAENSTILEAAKSCNVEVPALCACDKLEPYGSCRMCLVEVHGQKGLKAACHTLVQPGMNISTKNQKINAIRRNILELYFSEQPKDLIDDGRTELTQLAKQYNVNESRYKASDGRFNNALSDTSNPYFIFDPTKCIVCSRCVRACEDIQGTFALTISKRGIHSKVTASQNESFMDSECVSCGACVQTCPTDALIEKSILDHGMPEQHTVTTCGYCGVGCSFVAETKNNKVVRMLPYNEGKANHGHSCVKGRFAYGYSVHPDRLVSPMIRHTIEEPWQEVSWDKAISHAADELLRIKKAYGKNAIGGITSSRCTNEETYLVQKLIRAAIGTNNVDTCARVCHSPTGYGLKTTLGTSAGTQHFDSVESAELIMVIGANPTDAHPVFASQLKKALRDGAKLIVIDPRKIDLVESPHIKAEEHLALKPGTNVAIINALAHVIVQEGLLNEKYINSYCDLEDFQEWLDFIKLEQNSPEQVAQHSGVPEKSIRNAALLYAKANTAAIYYGLGVTEHSQGSTMVMGMANLAMATGNLGKLGAGVNPLRGQNNVQGSCDMGSFPHELPGYRHVSEKSVRDIYEKEWGVELDYEPGLRIPNMIDSAVLGTFKAIYIQGEDIAQSDPNIKHIEAGLKNMECVIVQDIFMNETSRYAHVVFPGASFLEKDGTFTNAERRINRVREVLPPLSGKADWQITYDLSKALGYEMDYTHPSQIMDEIARTTPTFSGVSYNKLDKLGSVQWPCNEKAPEGTPVMHVDGIVRGKGKFMITSFIPTEERTTRKFPLLLTTGRILSQYNVGTQTRRTENVKWANEDVLEIHPDDAELRGIRDNEWVLLKSRMGETTLKAKISQRMQPGIVYTTFHFAESGTNVITTEYSDWATECPEYKVTAVEISPTNRFSEWQEENFNEKELERIFGPQTAAE